MRATSAKIERVTAPAWPLQTDRLLLRPFARGDLDALYAIHSNEEVARYLYNEPRTLEEVRELLDLKIAGAEVRREGHTLNAAVVLRQTGGLVGDVSLHWASETHSQGEIGFLIHPAWHGNGFATEAARPVLAFAFEKLRLHRVIGRTEARNLGSARVLEKLGMRREAHLVENEWVKNEWQSELIYALLSREWSAQSVQSDNDRDARQQAEP
jgi:RimJ/RimL family protein N-acetyltransferase